MVRGGIERKCYMEANYIIIMVHICKIKYFEYIF